MNERSSRRAPVEPLSPQAWQRVESAVFARLDDGVALSVPSRYAPQYARATRRWLRYHWVISVGLSGAAAAAVSVIHMARSAGSAWPADVTLGASTEGALSIAPSPSLESWPSAAPATPPVLRAAPAAARASASALDTSPDALHVATGRETRDIAVGDALFTLSEHSEMLARGNDVLGWQVELARGRVDFDIAPRQARPPFVIRSGDVEVRVVSTRFSVRRDGASTEVRVLRGTVEVERQGRVARLRPGDLWFDGVVAETTHGARGASSAAERANIARETRR